MGNLATNSDFQRMIATSQVAQQRSLSRYGDRESIETLPPETGQWFALRCHGSSERLAAAGLIARRFDVYLPVVWIKERPRRGSVREVERPMFACYLFIRCLPQAGHLNRVRNVAGVQQILGEGAPEPMPTQAIDAIRLAEACEATKHGKPQLRWDFKPSDRVQIMEGPFAWFYAEIISAIDDRGRVAALVNIFGRRSKIELPADVLEKITDSRVLGDR